MQYKMLALDLDGTLTDSNKQVTPRTAAALAKAAEKGVRIVLASGRPTVGVQYLAKELELDKLGGYILSYNGGCIVDCATGAVVAQGAGQDRRLYPELQRRPRQRLRHRSDAGAARLPAGAGGPGVRLCP